MNLQNNKERQMEPQHNSEPNADNSQVSPLAQNRLLSAALSVDEILSGNRLIAEFMCWDRTEPTNSTLFEQSIKHTQYHRSWDWLMPVVEKIEKLGNYVWIMHSLYDNDGVLNQISIGNIKTNACHPISSKRSINKIEATWLVVLEFIKWYNDNAVSVGSR